MNRRGFIKSVLGGIAAVTAGCLSGQKAEAKPVPPEPNHMTVWSNQYALVHGDKFLRATRWKGYVVWFEGSTLFWQKEDKCRFTPDGMIFID